MDQKILFICTGNYYRSRFAEMLFNAQAARLGLCWKADSRGIEPSSYNIGPIYLPVLKKLETLGIPVEAKLRMPIQLKTTDLKDADLVVALDAAEHKLWMKQRFAEWADEILYWNVPDLNLMGPEEALSQIEKNVTVLVQQLRDQ
jgi:protein-tyrosine phosphatase